MVDLRFRQKHSSAVFLSKSRGAAADPRHRHRSWRIQRHIDRV